MLYITQHIECVFAFSGMVADQQNETRPGQQPGLAQKEEGIKNKEVCHEQQALFTILRNTILPYQNPV